LSSIIGDLWLEQFQGQNIWGFDSLGPHNVEAYAVWCSSAAT